MPGHRVKEVWMGEPIETLADLFPSSARIVCIGINPSPTSVEIGHYYQGKLGQRFFRRLQIAQVLPDQITGFEDDAAFDLGVGFTDIVKRPTKRASDVSDYEFKHGRILLKQKLNDVHPEVIIFTFKVTATKLLGKFDGCGWLNSKLFGDSHVFVMPGPYAPREEVSLHLESLRKKLGN